MIDALIKIEPIILNLESTVGIMTHLVDGEVESVHPDEWNNLLNDMRRGCSESKRFGTPYGRSRRPRRRSTRSRWPLPSREGSSRQQGGRQTG